MEEETAGHVLITADHDAEDRPVYRILSLGPEAAPPDAVATREDAEQWVAAWHHLHGRACTTDQAAGRGAGGRRRGTMRVGRARERGATRLAGCAGLALLLGASLGAWPPDPWRIPVALVGGGVGIWAFGRLERP